jgi:hypothetical protein
MDDADAFYIWPVLLAWGGIFCACGVIGFLLIEFKAPPEQKTGRLRGFELNVPQIHLMIAHLGVAATCLIRLFMGRLGVWSCIFKSDPLPTPRFGCA